VYIAYKKFYCVPLYKCAWLAKMISAVLQYLLKPYVTSSKETDF